MGKKHALCRLLHAMQLTVPLAALRAAVRSELRIVTYHRVLDVDDYERFEFDPGLVSASEADFRWQAEFVKKNYSPITFAHLVAALDGKRTLPARPVIMTFDDGYSDNYVAGKILNELGVPATMFLSTAYIGTTLPFWYDRVYNLLLTRGDGDVRLEVLNQTLHFNGSPASRRNTIGDVLEQLKHLENARRLEALDEIEATLGGPLPHDGFPLCKAMTWEQVRELSKGGIEFGAHTVTHPNLASLDDESLQRELMGAKQEIENQTGQPVISLTYPFGRPFTYNDHVIAKAAEAGYRVACVNTIGMNSLDALDHFRLTRFSVERDITRPIFAGMLGVPQLAS